MISEERGKGAAATVEAIPGSVSAAHFHERLDEAVAQRIARASAEAGLPMKTVAPPAGRDPALP